MLSLKCSAYVFVPVLKKTRRSQLKLPSTCSCIRLPFGDANVKCYSLKEHRVMPEFHSVLLPQLLQATCHYTLTSF